MFLTEYKTTCKNLFRSSVFWLSLCILLIIAIYEAAEVSYAYFDPSIGETIWDNDPRYVLTFQTYVQTVMNACVANIMLYGMPIVTVISTALILFRDHRDGFFEIQKASGLRPHRYLLPHLSALLTINFVVAFLATELSLSFFVITRGGVDGYGLGYILLDSLVRVARVTACIALPNLMLYISLTYAVGSVLKSSVAAAVAGFGYAIFFYAVNLMFRFRLASWYFDYFSPLPQKPREFFLYFGSEWHEGIIEMMGVTLGQALLAIGCLAAFALAYTLISYVCVKKRNI